MTKPERNPKRHLGFKKVKAPPTARVVMAPLYKAFCKVGCSGKMASGNFIKTYCLQGCGRFKQKSTGLERNTKKSNFLMEYHFKG